MKTFSCSLLSLFLSVHLFSQTISTQKPVIPAGEKIIVTYTGFPGNPADWIGIVPVNYTDEQLGQWYYTEGKSSGTMTFPAMAVGEYEVRAFFNNSYKVEKRYRFSVGTASVQLWTDKPSFNTGEAVIINYSGFPGNAQDWIAVAPEGYADDKASQWFYTEGKKEGTMSFSGLSEGNYEARAYYNNAYEVKTRYKFTINKSGATTSSTVTGIPAKLCRRELSTFYAGIGGLGSAWGRAAHEPTIMNPGAIADMQAVIGNAKAAIVLVKCIPYDVAKIDVLIAKLPSLTNVQAVAEIEATIKEIQGAVATVTLDCGTNLSSLYVLGIHMGAAQAHASSQMFMPTPMPADLQTVIFNHLKTAQDAFASFMPCVPGFPLSSITSANLNSLSSVEPHINIIMTHCNILWAIALSDCCCNCK